MDCCVHPLEITYTVSADGRSITFHPCGITSINPTDIKERYCARCHRWMDLIELAKKMSKPDYQFR